MMKIGFIGLGHMGQPMVLNLLKAGYEVHVYDVNPQATATLVKAGAVAEKSIVALADIADAFITMVQTGEQVRDIYLSHDGLFSRLKQDNLYIDCSSIDIVTTRALHAAASERKVTLVDAPVSGGVAGAMAATLTIMVGGTDNHFKRAEPILSLLGKKIVHAGVGGSGQAAKICNNLLLGISMIGVSEAFALAEKLGLEANKFFEISANASGQCWSMTSYCPVPGLVEAAPSNRDYQPGFTAKMMLKDLRLGQHAAEAVSASIPLGAAATELYELFVNKGNGELDFSGIIKFIKG
jgi:3-hydroxyisobutyrate dehydrogenase